MFIQAQKCDDFGESDGTHDFSTLKINRSADKTAKEGVESPVKNDQNTENPLSDTPVSEPHVKDKNDDPSSSESP